jgi:hypothetical protein
MSSLKFLVVLLVPILMMFTAGCDDGGDCDDGCDQDHNNGNGSSSTTSQGNGAGNNGGGQSGNTEYMLTLRNEWTSTITFTVNGSPYTVSPSGVMYVPYSGTVTVTAPSLSVIWTSGNHVITAVVGQVSTIPDYNAG